MIVDQSIPSLTAEYKYFERDMELLQIVWDHYEYMDAFTIMRDRKAELLLEQAQKNKMMFRLMGEKLRHRLENQFSY